jgi:hypothetical protein
VDQANDWTRQQRAQDLEARAPAGRCGFRDEAERVC